MLVLVFVILGIVVYQLTAPPGKGGGFSVSFGETARRALREMRSENSNADHKSESTLALAPAVQEVRISGVREVTIIGESRPDIATELVVNSSGVDKADAERLAAAATLVADATPGAIAFSVSYPQQGRQTAKLTLRLPSRLTVRLEEIRSGIRVSDVARLQLAATRGETVLTNISGAVEGDHRGGSFEVVSAGSVRLTLRSADVQLRKVAGPTQLDLTGGELKAGTLDGPLTIESRSADITVDTVTGEVKVNATAGSVTLGGLRQSVRCDGQHTDIRLTMLKPAPVTVFTTGGSVELATPSTAGASIDAAATGGEVRVSGLDIPVRQQGDAQRATGTIAGGGPTISLRTTGGTITLKAAGRP